MKQLKTLFTILLVAVTTVAFAQSKDLKKATKFYKLKQYAEAIPLFEKSLEEKVSLPIQTKLAFCYKAVNQIDKAEKLYSDIVYADKPKDITFYYYGEALMRNGKYAAAKFWFEEYLKKKPGDTNSLRMIESCDRVNMIKPYFGHVEVTPFPMNSDSDDNAPVMLGDQIVFCSDRKQKAKLLKQKSGVTGRDYVSLYKSTKQADGTFSEPQPFSAKINGLNKNTGPISFNAAGNYAVFSRNSDIASKKDAYSLALYHAVYDGSKWKDIQPFEFCSPEFNYMHPAISPDGQKLFFVSDKPGGVGGTELYSVERKADGTWGRPTNMGAFINTEGHEGFPFYDSKGRLFFSSKGHIGFGGYDVFFTKEENGSWSRPVNVGFPVNSSSDDISIYVSPDDQSGMFTSGRSGTSDDIFFFKVAQEPIETEASPLAVSNTSSPSSTAIVEPKKEILVEQVPEAVTEVIETEVTAPAETLAETMQEVATPAAPVVETPEVVTETIETEVTQQEESLTEIMAETEVVAAPVIESEVVVDSPKKVKKNKKDKKIKTSPVPEETTEVVATNVEQVEPSLTEVMAEMETAPSPVVETEVVVDTPKKVKKSKKDKKKKTTPVVEPQVAIATPSTPAVTTEVEQVEPSLTEVMAEMEAAPSPVVETEVVVDTPKNKKDKTAPVVEPQVAITTPESETKLPEESLTEIMAGMESTPDVETELEVVSPSVETAPSKIIEPQKINVKPEMVEETLAIESTDQSAASTLIPGNALFEFNADVSNNAIDIDKTYRVPNVDFDFNDVNLNTSLTVALDELAKILKANPKIEIQLIGHTASFGNNTKNQQLSEARAKIAAAYLMDKGVERHRVNHIGYGETQLLNECVDGILCSMDQHKVNERLEVKVMRH